MIRPIIRGPDKILTTVSQPADLSDPHHLATLQDLADTIRDTPRAMGLAAVQIGHLIRAAAIRTPGEIVIICNPVVVESFGGNREQEEECLSYPWLKGVKVIRPWGAAVEYETERNPERVIERCSGKLARCIMHEIDHMNGITIDLIRRRRQ